MNSALATGPMRLTLLLVGLTLLLSACVTTTTGNLRKSDPEKALKSFIQLGIGYIRNSEYERARENLNKALEIDPNSAETYNAFGLLFEVQRETALAEKNYRKAVTLEPKSSQFRNNYGAFLFAQQRYEEAIKQLELAAADVFYRARAQVYENLGICYLRTSQPQAAEQAFEKSVSLSPRQARALLELGDLSFDRQDYVAADAHLKRYLAVSAQSARSLWLGIRLAKVFGRNDEEASYALVLKNIFPGSEEYKKYQASAK